MLIKTMSSEKKFYLTKQGLEKIKKEYEDLKALRLAKTSGEMPKIWHSEDLNQEYMSIQEDVDFLEIRLAEVENVLNNVELLKAPPKNQQNIINLGATVTLEEKDGQLNEFMIVGTLEVNPGEGKISPESPVGRVLLGKKIGEDVVINLPNKVIYKVKKIRYCLD